MPPLWRTLFKKGVDPFPRIFRRHQILQIAAFQLRQRRKNVIADFDFADGLSFALSSSQRWRIWRRPLPALSA